jgi:transcriptional regulator GlxA family with amidase domain
MRIAIVLFDGFDELDALGPYEVLRRAAEAGANMQTTLATIDDVAEMTAFYGATVRPQERLTLDDRPDIVVVPGGGWNHRGGNGARVVAQEGRLPALLRQLHDVGTVMAGVCTGAMLLATAGILQGRPATTHHLALGELRATEAQVIDARIVDDGDVITAAGVTSGIDLALWLVERFAGAEIAVMVERRLEYERRSTVWRRSQGVTAR